jgi:hypothetical protein
MLEPVGERRLLMAIISSMEPKDIFTLLIALYGAGLSTYLLWRSKRHLRVYITPDFRVYADGAISTQMVSIKVVNTGFRPVGITVPTIRLPNGKFVSFTDVDGLKSFPKRLEDGETASLSMTMRKLANSLKEAGQSGKVTIRPCCYDTAEKRWFGKRFRVDTDREWNTR